MKNKTLFLMIALSVSLSSIFAQSFFQTYTNTGNQVLDFQSTDTGYTLHLRDEATNALKIIETDALGNQLSSQLFFPNSANFTYDKGFFFETGAIGDAPNRDMLIRKLDGDSSTIWEKTIPRPLDNLGIKILPMREGNLMIAGISQVAVDTLYRITLTKITNSGALIWQTYIEASATRYDQVLGYLLNIQSSDVFPLKEPVIKGLLETADGFLIRNSVGYNGGGVYTYEENFIKVDEWGRTLWNKSILMGSKNIAIPVPSANFNGYSLRDWAAYDNGSVLLTYNTKIGTSSVSRAFAMSLNPSGATCWSISRGGHSSGNAYPYAITTRPDGGAWWVLTDESMWHYAIGYSRSGLLSVLGISPSDGSSSMGEGSINNARITSTKMYDFEYPENYDIGTRPSGSAFTANAVLSDDNDNYLLAGKYLGGILGEPAEEVSFFLKENLSDACPTGLEGFIFYGTYNGHQYFISKETVDWATANDLATAANAQLVSIHSSGEQDFIQQQSLGNKVWIGLDDAQNEGTLQWADGAAINYSNFFNCTPDCDNSEELDHFVLDFWENGKWKLEESTKFHLAMIELDCGLQNDLSADLKIVKIDGLPETTRRDEILQLEVAILNLGGASVNENFNLKYYLSEDKTLSADDIEIGDMDFSNINMSDTIFTNITLQIPSTLPFGLYRMLAFVDEGATISESNEGNNVSLYQTSIEVTDSGIDLKIKSVAGFAYNTIAQQGEILPFEFELQNLGNETITEHFALQVYMSNSYISSIQNPSSGFLALEIQIEEDIPPGTTILPIDFIVPPNIPVNSYYFGFQIDALNHLAELKEDNNSFRYNTSLRVEGDYGPDLIPTAVSAVPSVIAQGETLQFSFNILNAGETTITRDFKTDALLSENPWYNFYSPVKETIETEFLHSQNSNTHTVSLLIPHAFDAGTYYLIIKTDRDGDIKETDDNNNTYVSIPIQILEAPSPDLQVSNLVNFPTTVTQGDVVQYQFDLTNAGNKPVTGDYHIRKYISPFGSLGLWTATEVGEILTGWTPIGTIAEVPGAVTIPEDLPAGTYYLQILADPENIVSESVENNNRVYITIEVLSTASDFEYELNCPEAIEITAPIGATQALVTWDDNLLSSSNNCQSNLHAEAFGQDFGRTSGSYFPIGTDTIQYSISGICKDIFNVATCQFAINVLERSIVYSEQTIELCEGESYQGQIYFENTTLSDTITLSNYDSIATTHISVFSTYQIEIYQTTCDPNDVGTTTCILFSQQGCDSIVTTIVTLLDSSETFLFLETCDPNEVGIEVIVFTAQNGCDSTVTYTTSLMLATESNLNTAICADESIVVNGTLYDKNNPIGTEIIVGGNWLGCDSLIHVALECLPNGENELRPKLCLGKSIEINGILYDENHPTGTEVFPNANWQGCDSVLLIEIEWLPNGEGELQPEICTGESVEINGTIYDENHPTGTEVFPNANWLGCDSLLYIQLILLPNIGATFNLELMPGDLYNNVPIWNDTSFTEIYVAANGCDSIVEVEIMVTEVGTQDFLDKNVDWSLSPNPTTNEVWVEFENPIERNWQLQIVNIAGQRVLETAILESKTPISLAHLPSGVYSVLVISKEGKAVKKLVIH